MSEDRIVQSTSRNERKRAEEAGQRVITYSDDRNECKENESNNYPMFYVVGVQDGNLKRRFGRNDARNRQHPDQSSPHMPLGGKLNFT
jgi:hypothetical protein